MTILQHQIFILKSNLWKKIPNSKIILTQICPNIENSENFTEQIFSIKNDKLQGNLLVLQHGLKWQLVN